MKRKYLVFDSHPIIGEGMKSLINEIDRDCEVFFVTKYQEAIRVLKYNEIDLLILDVNLRDCDGVDFFRRTKVHGYRPKTIFFSAERESAFSKMAFGLGADGYVCKRESQETLINAIKAVLKGGDFFKYKERLGGKKLSLSNREFMVKKLLLQGLSNKEIANVLSISDKTVSTYKSRILEKFRVKSVIELHKVDNDSRL
ncbi:response regulator transcription factor [Vibrio harveyi]|nr:response regulator transcription factor [Vibrio harveyi]